MGDDVVDPDMAKYEEEADRFAADTLIPPDELAKLPLHKADELTNNSSTTSRSRSESVRAS